MREMGRQSGDKQLLRPRALERGDPIALISPASFPKDEAAMSGAEQAVELLGLVPVLSPNLGKRLTYLAGTDEERIHDISWALSNRELKGIICIRGGYGTMRLLRDTNWDLFQRNPKVFVGMSDITAFQLAALRANIITFAGPMPLLGETPGFSDYAKTMFWGAVGPNHGLLQISSGPDDPEPIQLAPGLVSGPLVGGNLQTLVSLIGTPWMPWLSKRILVLEEIAESPYRVDRLLTQLLLSGAMDGVLGVAMGRFRGCYEEGEDEIVAVLKERLEHLGIPLLYGLALGHQPDIATWPQGCVAELNTENKTLHLLEMGVVTD